MMNKHGIWQIAVTTWAENIQDEPITRWMSTEASGPQEALEALLPHALDSSEVERLSKVELQYLGPAGPKPL
jgi:hypothetical protein